MQNILRALDLKKELDSLRPLNKDQEEKIMQKFRLDWNYHSNHLEGNSLTFGETKNLILHGITAQGKPLKDHFEITGHNEALNWIIDIVKEDRPLTENFIRELHTLLLKESYYVEAITPDGKETRKKIEVGRYKTSPNHVRTSTGEVFRFAEPEETAAKMHDLLEWYRLRKEEPDINPIILAAEFHYKFIVIHPFDDGNGRMARILMNFILMTFQYPPVIIKTDDKTNYFFALRQADNGDIESFVDYIAKNLVRSFEIMIAGAKGESIEDPDDIDKNIALLEHRLKGIGKPAKAFKTQEILNNLFQDQLSTLLERYLNDNAKFNRFYVGYSVNLSISYHDTDVFSSDRSLSFDEADIFTLISAIGHLINDNPDISEIHIKYIFKSFSYPGFEDFSYTNDLIFRFSNIRYEVKLKDIVYTKDYTDLFSNKEINDLLKKEMKLHAKLIESKIKEYEEKNK